MASYDDIIEALTDKKAEPWTFPEPQAQPIADLSPAERAAMTMQRSVMPAGGRQEGPITRDLTNAVPRVMGGVVNQLTYPSQYGDVYQPGMSVRDLPPEATDWAAGTAMGLTGLSRVAGGAPSGAIGAGGGGKPPIRNTQLPDIRSLPTDEAIAIARGEPHLIPSAEGSAGAYVGGPRNVQSKRDLNRIRKEFDAMISADPRGGDWYQRARGDIGRVTGSPEEANWMAGQHKQWSAGVSPESELQFALRENNAALAGDPARSYRGREHQALIDAIAARDPSLLVEGEKTAQYGRLIDPSLERVSGAVGTNDFRHAANLGYTETSGAPMKKVPSRGQTSAFMDYETALAVDRANKNALGGRTDWTGESLQASPWIRQKAQALMEQRGLDYETAYTEATKTIGDFFPKHRAFATHEAIPGSETGHLSGLLSSPEMRAEFSADPRSTWAHPQTGRDVIYGGMNLPGTGVAARVEPTIPTQGVYTNPQGVTEYNPGWSARPLVSFQQGKGGMKSVPPQERAMLDTAESVRAYIDAQNAGAWHKSWQGGPVSSSRSFFVPSEGMSSIADLAKYRDIGARYGLPDVVDTGKGVTMTSFYPPPAEISPKTAKAVMGEIADVSGGTPYRVKVEPGVDTGYAGYEDVWKQGTGSGAATKKLLNDLDAAPPTIRAAIDANHDIARKALGNLERDKEWMSRAGAAREDIQNARRIIGEGPGWVSRLREALAAGAVLPAVAAAVLGNVRGSAER